MFEVGCYIMLSLKMTPFICIPSTSSKKAITRLAHNSAALGSLPFSPNVCKRAYLFMMARGGYGFAQV